MPVFTFLYPFLPSLSFPPLVSLQRLRQFQASEAKQARTQQLKEMEIFKEADEDSEALDTSVLMFVVSGSAMWAASNNIFTTRMQEAAEMWDKALQRKLIWAYLMAPIYAPPGPAVVPRHRDGDGLWAQAHADEPALEDLHQRRHHQALPRLCKERAPGPAYSRIDLQD